MNSAAEEISNIVEFPFTTTDREPIEKEVKADLENGYTRIANELLEQAYKFPFTLVQLKAFLYIARTTYGWRQKGRYIPHSEFNLEGIIRTDKVGQLLRSLVDCGVLVSKVGRHSTYISINTTISKWSKSDAKKKKSTPKQGVCTPKQGVKTPKQGAYTPKLTGHIIKEENIKEENNNYCSAKAKPQSPKDQIVESQAREAIDYLNLKAKKKFKHSKTSLKPVKARLRDGFSIDDLKTIIDSRTAVWINDPKMNEYLRPITLFGEKAESYLNADKPGAANQSTRAPTTLDDFKNKNYRAGLEEF